MKFFKKFLCNHLWGKKIENKYIDYFGNKVGTRTCIICGKKSKFY